MTIASGTNPGSGTLSGTLTVAAVNGTAPFSTLSIDKIGTGYTLAATSGVLTGATSTTFNITPAAPAKLVFGVQPTNTALTLTISPAVTVQIEDANGNLTIGTANVTIAIGSNPGGGTLTVAAVSGMATFNTLSIDKSGIGYTLTATLGALTGATSNTFNIIASTPTATVTSINTARATSTNTAISTATATATQTPTSTATFTRRPHVARPLP